MKCARPKYKQIFIIMKYKNVNTKKNKTKLQNKIVPQTNVKQIKNNGWSYLNLSPFEDLVKGSFHGGFHVPIDHGSFLRGFPTISEL